jgi:protein tyrosine/serine phosphatase
MRVRATSYEVGELELRGAIPQFLCSALLAAPAGACAVIGLKSYIGRYNGNLRAVDPGQVFRSGQLTGARLRDALTSLGIRAVLNLRGPLPGDVALLRERQTCRKLGLAHVDLDLKLGRLPTPEAVWELLHALDHLPRPLLIHCAAGSDRTGLAGAIYLHLHQGLPLRQAQASQLTWRYGHWPIRRAKQMDRFFDLYHRTGRGLPFRRWALEKYPEVYAAQAP